MCVCLVRSRRSLLLGAKETMSNDEGLARRTFRLRAGWLGKDEGELDRLGYDGEGTQGSR